MSYLDILQVIIGLVGILFLPGLLLTYIFFPKEKQKQDNSSNEKKKKDLDPIERFLLSFALSMAVVPLALFFLNKLGMKINQLNVILVLAVILILEIGYLIYCKKSAYGGKQSSNLNTQ